MSSGIRLLVLLFAGGFLLVGLLGCEGEQGPAGQPGTAECFNCHSDDYAMAMFLLPVEAQYAASQHALGESFVRRGSTASPTCSRCHTNEGFQQFVVSGTPAAVSESSPIGCFTCHAPHTRMDFTQRKQGATTLLTGGTYDKQESNTCAMCHQMQVPSPAFADGAVVGSNRWGPHHGAQANILTGTGAYVFAGEEYEAEAGHSGIANGCVKCHMDSVATDGMGGGHSFKVAFDYHGSDRINSASCRSCHSGWTDATATTEVEDAQAEFEARLDDLRQDLLALGWIDSEDLVVPRTFEFAADMGAVYNFLALIEDRSGGIHNLDYTDDVLTATQTYVTSRLLP